MKKNVLTFLSLFFIFAAPSLAEEATSQLTVKGMFCEGCSSKVEKTLKSVSGVNSASVNYDKGTASVQYDNSKVQPEKLAEKVTDVGFETTVAR